MLNPNKQIIHHHYQSIEKLRRMHDNVADKEWKLK